MSATRPLPTVIGPTENALRALLTKILAATRIKSYRAWVVLNAAHHAAAPSPGGSWQQAVADALKVEHGEIDAILAQLRTAGLVGNDGSLTALGATELARARSGVSTATARLVDGVGEEEQVIARRVLDHVRRKAEELLHA